MGYKDTQDYERYTTLTGGRPDDKLPPLDFQDGALRLVPGEVWCRWREDISGILCDSDGYQDERPLRTHYERVHGATLSGEHPTEGRRNQGMISRWYADVVNGLQPSWPRSVQTARLSVQDLIRGSVYNQVDYQSAVRLTRLFNKHSPDMPPKVGEELRDMLVSGAFQHTQDSLQEAIKHQTSKEMFDAVNNEPKWINITYERWFILVGVYGVKTLRQECQGIVGAVLTRCGEELDKSLTYKHGPDDSKPHVSALITQMSDTIAKQQKAIDHLNLLVEGLTDASC
ncbi:hypothetical protein H9Q69_008886 [Fusarium xylarioides]|nr:hypothetical protein H9Q70_005277 [Fusarium xylarioides]KAG5780463.1 hypothetical protein H9Q73_005905 [Fusarium xylarioides]KAG5792066.1 hypothetical protein H9Q69_008886 [Fusarium xylarioides]KAG5808358.1 hypothetical protein H9Q71_007107 [Fusarium xylarioides]KAG5823539.1 hypothetical protein H9Q74_006377 [Fusarium xylarioides]